MDAYCQEVRKLEDKFRGIELHHVPRGTTTMPMRSPRWQPSGIQLPTGSSPTTSMHPPSVSSQVHLRGHLTRYLEPQL
jgi:hypothetical protein